MPDIDAIRVNVNTPMTTSIGSTPRALDASQDLNVLVRDGLLEIQVESGFQEARVYDVSGTLRVRSDRKSIPIGSLKPGTYLVNVRTDKGTYTKAFAHL